MTAPILLSTFVKGLSGKDLPPEVEEHRVRLRRSAANSGTIENPLQKWTAAINEEQTSRQAFSNASRREEGATKEEKEHFEASQKHYLKSTKEMSKVLHDTGEIIVASSPSIEGHSELLRHFKHRRVFVPEPFPAREFVRQDEHSNPDYKQLLVNAANVAYEKARNTFTPQVRRYNWTIGLLGFFSLNSFGASIVLFHDNPLRLSIGLLLCFDILLAVAYIFYRMSRSKEFQLKAYIQKQVEAELKRARADIAAREEERYKAFLEEERERREAFEQEQKKKRLAFDRSEAQRIEAIQPLLTGKTVAIETVLNTLFPLRLPVPCGVSYKVVSASIIEVTIQLPDDRIIPPRISQTTSSLGRFVQADEETELIHQCSTLAASLAIRVAAEILFHVPTCNTVVVRGIRSSISPSTQRTIPLQVLHAEIDRKTLAPMGRTISPMIAIKRFKHRFTAPEHSNNRNSA